MTPGRQLYELHIDGFPQYKHARWHRVARAAEALGHPMPPPRQAAAELGA